MGTPQNLDELQERLRSTVMVRRLKSEVLTELPAKRRQVVVLEVDGADKLVAREREVEERVERTVADATYRVQKAEAEGSEDYQAAVAALNAARGIAFSEMARVRHETALAKLPAAIEQLRNANGKCVIFAHHLDVIDGLRSALEGEGGVVVITGDTKVEERQTIVERFQNDPSVRFFIGNMRAAGVGITLTASSHVVFVELDWTPAVVSQAEDRCHRIGQRDSVFVQHLVVDGSIDAKIAKALVDKQRIADAALDDEHDEIVYAAPEVARPTEPVSVEKPKLVVTLTSDQVQAVHTVLRILAGLDTDRASAKNDVGYNRMDTKFGNELAEKTSLSPRQAAAAMRMVRKYRRQYPADLYARIYEVEKVVADSEMAEA
jgi:hypothetical protein